VRIVVCKNEASFDNSAESKLHSAELFD
jgi:hypothetical protein